MDIMKLEGAIGLSGALCNAAYKECENDLRLERQASKTVTIPNSNYDCYKENNRNLQDITNKVSEATIKAIRSSIDDNGKNIIIINNIICY